MCLHGLPSPTVPEGTYPPGVSADVAAEVAGVSEDGGWTPPEVAGRVPVTTIDWEYVDELSMMAVLVVSMVGWLGVSDGYPG